MSFDGRAGVWGVCEFRLYPIDELTLLFFVRDDSYVDISSVPSLKTLARSSHVTGGLYQAPISVKEGLEYYHSIVWKE